MVSTINDRDMKRAAVVEAHGYQVNIFKLCSPRCVAEYPDLPAVRQLLQEYESGKVLKASPKAIMTAYGRIMGACKSLKQGAV